MTPAPNGSGIEYPHVTLGGVTYEVKMTRGTLLYRLSRNGIDLRELTGPKAFSTMVDTLHACIQGHFRSNAESLAEVIMAEDKAVECSNAVNEALKKAFPPLNPAKLAAMEPASQNPS